MTLDTVKTSSRPLAVEINEKSDEEPDKNRGKRLRGKQLQSKSQNSLGAKRGALLNMCHSSFIGSSQLNIKLFPYIPRDRS